MKTLSDVNLRELGYGKAIEKVSEEIDRSKSLDAFSGSFLLAMAFNVPKEMALEDLIAHRKKTHERGTKKCSVCGANFNKGEKP